MDVLDNCSEAILSKNMFCEKIRIKQALSYISSAAFKDSLQ